MTTPNVLATRYASPAMRDLWAPQSKIVAERQLWLAVLEAQRDLGVDFAADDPDQVLAAYRAVIDQVGGERPGQGCHRGPVHRVQRVVGSHPGRAGVAGGAMHGPNPGVAAQRPRQGVLTAA